MDRNLIDQLTLTQLGISTGAGKSLDILDDNETVTGAGGVVLGIILNIIPEAGDTVTLEESDDDSTFNVVRTDDLTWKPQGAARDPGQFEQGANPIDVAAAYGAGGSRQFREILVQYDGTKRYVRLTTSAGIVDADIKDRIAITRHKYRGDAAGGV